MTREATLSRCKPSDAAPTCIRCGTVSSSRTGLVAFLLCWLNKRQRRAKSPVRRRHSGPKSRAGLWPRMASTGSTDLVCVVEFDFSAVNIRGTLHADRAIAGGALRTCTRPDDAAPQAGTGWASTADPATARSSAVTSTAVSFCCSNTSRAARDARAAMITTHTPSVVCPAGIERNNLSAPAAADEAGKCLSFGILFTGLMSQYAQTSRATPRAQ